MKRSYAYEDGKESFIPGEVCSWYEYAIKQRISGLDEFNVRRDFEFGWNDARRIYEMKHNEENILKCFLTTAHGMIDHVLQAPYVRLLQKSVQKKIVL